MHIGAFDAHMLPRLLALYKANGFRFVTLSEAAKDLANIGLVDPKLPALAGRTLSDARIDGVMAHIGTLCQ